MEIIAAKKIKKELDGGELEDPEGKNQEEYWDYFLLELLYFDI